MPFSMVKYDVERSDASQSIHSYVHYIIVINFSITHVTHNIRKLLQYYSYNYYFAFSHKKIYISNNAYMLNM